jgi:peptide-methionine (S)-S-oxide reductase
MEAPFDKLPGVLSSTSGFAGGQTKNPTYEQVSSGSTGHAEAVQVLYDPKRITYAQLLETFWHNIDPLDKGGQFCDRGNQYRSAVFYGNDEERKEAEASRARVEQRLGRPVVTQIVAAGAFYPAEEYHQDFYRKNPARYNQYRTGCGRDRRLKELWGADAGGHGGSR